MNVETRIRPAPAILADPITFFDGRVEAEGFFTSVTGVLKRRFTATFLGAPSGSSIAIDEVLVYHDGQVDRRTWALSRVSSDRWAGTATDVVSDILIDRLSDCETRWRYAMDLQVGRRTIRFHFEDQMVQTGPDQWLSTTAVRKFGIPLAHILCCYRRVGPAF
jgi:Protein of unknown function (DUF3833)